MSLNPLMLFSGFIMGSIAAYIAHKRDKNPYLWFFIGFFFGIVGIFAIFWANQKKPNKSNPRVPQAVIQGPKDKFWYYLDVSQERQGPVSYSAMMTNLKTGKLNESTLVWHEDLSDWKELKGLITLE